MRMRAEKGRRGQGRERKETEEENVSDVKKRKKEGPHYKGLRTKAEERRGGEKRRRN